MIHITYISVRQKWTACREISLLGTPQGCYIKKLMRKDYIKIIIIILLVLLGIIVIAKPKKTQENKEFIRVSVFREVDGEITAYSSSVDETDDTPFIMASNERVYHGAIACPSRYEFGTKVYIDGEEYTCDDRMNGKYRDGNYFDIWKASKAEALKYGRQHKKVKVAVGEEVVSISR